MSISFRLATMDDIPALTELIPLSVRALCAGHYTEEQIEGALIDVFGVDSQLIRDGTFFVAAAGTEIVGCGGWSKRKTLYGGDHARTQEDELLDPAADAARIRAFFVHPEWTRQGIGRYIMEQCEAAARESGFTQMELGATAPGEPLYASMGFVVTDRFEIALPNGAVMQAAHMEKPMSG